MNPNGIIQHDYFLFSPVLLIERHSIPFFSRDESPESNWK